MRRSTRRKVNGDVELLESARGGQQDSEHKVVWRRRRKQHTQRIALIEMIETGDPAAAAEADFGRALDQ